MSPRAKRMQSGHVAMTSEAINSRFTNMFKAFKDIDRDGSGVVEEAELIDAMRRWNLATDDAKIRVQPHLHVAKRLRLLVVHDAQTCMTLAHALIPSRLNDHFFFMLLPQELITLCDKDGDKKISYKEFVDNLARDTVAVAALGTRGMQAKEAMGSDIYDEVGRVLVAGGAHRTGH